MGLVARSGYHHGDLRTTLVGIAVELTEEQGVDGWSMREAARRAGVAHSAPYRHFADREALVDAVAVEGFVELQRRYEAAAHTARARVGSSGAAVAEAVARAYLEFAVDHPNLFALVFSGPDRHRSPEARSSYESFVRLTTGFEADAALTDEALTGGARALGLGARHRAPGQRRLLPTRPRGRPGRSPHPAVDVREEPDLTLRRLR